MTISAGTKLGSYEVLAPIGAGGMGEVYQAQDTKLGRDVAIKVLTEAFAHDPERLLRFQREAKMLAALNHPNIATIYGLEQSNGTNYLVMELVSGETLADRVKRDGAVPIEESLTIAKQIAEALEAAHEKGIIHRDLKPANVKVTPEGKVKVLDFGLAKAFEGDTANDNPSNSPTLSMAATMHGMILGTAAYMSPEQAKGKTVDRRADIWAFGVVLFEMLTGKQLYTGETAAETLASVIKEEPPFDRLPTTTPFAIRNLLRRCLEKDAKKRLRDVGDARIEIEEALSGATSAEPVGAQRKSRERLAWSLAAVFLIVALALSAVLLLQTSKPGLALQSSLLPPKDHSFYLRYFSLSPDGKKIAFVTDRGSTANNLLWIRSLDSTAAQPLPGTDGAYAPFWSPDGKFIGFFADGNVKKVDAMGGPVITLAGSGPITTQGGTWGGDGTIVFQMQGDGDGLYQVSSNGGAVSELTHVDNSHGETAHNWPFFLPDGRHLLFQDQFTGPSGEGYVQEIRVLDLKTKKQSVLLRADSNAQYANGFLLYVQQTNLMAQPFDLSALRVYGTPTPVAQQIQGAGKSAFSASPNGLLAFASGESASSQLVWYTREGKETGRVSKPGDYNMASLSPDGTRVATSLGETQGTKRDIWVFELARGTATRVTFDGMRADCPVWSRDGTRLVYADTERGAGIYTKPPTGLGGSEIVEQVRTRVAPNSISTDGKLLVYMNFPGGGFPRLWIHPFAPEKPDTKDYPLLGTKFAEAYAQFSPDGRWLAYASLETGKMVEVFVVSFPSLSSKLQISTAGGAQPRWRRDSKEIYYVGLDKRMMAVPVGVSGNSLTTDVPKPLFQTNIVATIGSVHQYDVTGDGQRFLINSDVEQNSEPITLYANWTAGLKK